MNTLSKTNRFLSIDAYRALVMLLMIFVNDTWTLINIPKWIGHLPADADGLGLADIVFPAFLFIVGLSIPMAIESRLRKGDSKYTISLHIILRAGALIIMGLFHVNMENYSSDAVLHKSLWQFLITIAFFLIWLDYENQKSIAARILKCLGFSLLLILAILYKGNSDNGSWISMEIHWWGILGMIGWCYLLISGIVLFSNGSWKTQLFTFVILILFNMIAQSSVSEELVEFKKYIWIVGDGALPALTSAGVLTSLFYLKMQEKRLVFVMWMFVIAALLTIFGLLARLEWNISKIWATPSFALVCSAISAIGFAIMVYIVEIRDWKKWYQWISPAGTSTLTCYLLPYLHYALLGVITWQLPEILRTGIIGVLKSISYAVLIILITGWLEKRKLRLKL